MNNDNVLTVLYVNGAWIKVEKMPNGQIGLDPRGVISACDDLSWPPPVGIVAPENPRGYITVPQMRNWGEDVSTAAAIQTHELAEIITTWVKKYESIKGPDHV